MMKKLTAIILSALLVLTVLTLPAFAADKGDVILSGDVLEAAVEAAAAALTPASPGAKVTVQSRMPQKAVAAKDLAKNFARYIFVNPSQVDGISSAIANDADYTVTVLENGRKTVYISVDLREHPEIANLDVFKAAVLKLNEKQGQVAAGDGDYDLMDYQHIAGELALHVIVAAAMSAIGRDESDSTLASSMVANLNKDESRFPEGLISFLGRFIMDYLLSPFQTILSKVFKA